MRVVAVVAHADDELTCAGTLRKFVEQGHDVGLIIAYDSDINRTGRPLGQTKTRRAEAKACAETLGVAAYLLMRQSEDALRWDQVHVGALETMALPADLLITHRQTDTNQTHATLAQIVRTVARKNNASIWTMDLALPGGWDACARPNLLVDITAQAQTKATAIDCYGSQLKRYPGMKEAIQHRDAFYGWALDQENRHVQQAEGFTIEKAVWL